MKYKLLIFDADDTLFDFKKAEEYALEKAMIDHKVSYDIAYHMKLYREINIAIWKEFEKGEITQKELKVERFNRFLEKIGESKDPKSFSESFMDHLSRASFLFEGVEEIIKKLSKTHRLVVVTNGLTRVQKIRVRQSIIAKYFEEIIISEEIGYAKPNPMIFDVGLANLTLPVKREMVMIGDSMTSDIPGGINYGIDTILFNPEEKKIETELSPTYVINNLEELFDIV